ncbi:integrase [Paenibacillus sp. BIHB 4019]|uniref:Integrase n=1 Tax=Paenibacillus sp. BIHB 4019 TaxID=1870819 RepID=A0A1B2DHR7_9BACL|nr:site-specific integrase [Paenibacillus sp. BIHB 4019]ANY67272.1 integrase [Paenibacillus sp. BIHB 4019]
MASIKKEGNTWRYVIDLPRDPVTNARRQKKKRGFKTKKEAEAAAATVLYELSNGIHVEETDQTFEQYSSHWLEKYELLGGVKESTVRIRKIEVKVLLRYFKLVKIKDITKKMYQAAITDMKKSGMADTSIRGTHGTARMIFKSAMEDGIIKEDPTQYAKIPRKLETVDDIENHVHIPKYLEKEELDLFLKIALEQGLEGDYETFLTLAYTGIRIGEFSVLRETDFDFAEESLSISKTYYNPAGKISEYKLQTPKTKTSKRNLQVDPLVVDVVTSYIKKIKSFKMLHRNTYYDKGYIFINQNKYPGYPMPTGHYQTRMKRILKLAGLNSSLTPHSMRHTHTSLLAEAGVPLHEIMERLGHKDDKVTRQVYLHVTKKRKKEAAIKFGEFMRST